MVNFLGLDIKTPIYLAILVKFTTRSSAPYYKIRPLEHTTVSKRHSKYSRYVQFAITVFGFQSEFVKIYFYRMSEYIVRLQIKIVYLNLTYIKYHQNYFLILNLNKARRLSKL